MLMTPLEAVGHEDVLEQELQEVMGQEMDGNRNRWWESRRRYPQGVEGVGTCHLSPASDTKFRHNELLKLTEYRTSESQDHLTSLHLDFVRSHQSHVCEPRVAAGEWIFGRFPLRFKGIDLGLGRHQQYYVGPFIALFCQGG